MQDSSSLASTLFFRLGIIAVYVSNTVECGHGPTHKCSPVYSRSDPPTTILVARLWMACPLIHRQRLGSLTGRVPQNSRAAESWLCGVAALLTHLGADAKRNPASARFPVSTFFCFHLPVKIARLFSWIRRLEFVGLKAEGGSGNLG